MSEHRTQATYLTLLAEARKRSPKADGALYVLDIIDTKSGGLLSFIGALMAGIFFYLGLVDSSAPPSLTARVFGLLALAVLAVASGLALSCIFITGEHQRQAWVEGYDIDKPLSEETMRRVEELWIGMSHRRSRRYVAALYLTFATGALLFMSLFFHYFRGHLWFGGP